MEIKDNGHAGKNRGGTTDNQGEPQLVPFKCDTCGKVLAWTLPGATVCCKQCGKWVNHSGLLTKQQPDRQGISLSASI